MTTTERLTKWADCVRLENFVGTHGMKWRCIIGEIEKEDYSLEIAVKKADEQVQSLVDSQHDRASGPESEHAEKTQ